MELINVTYNDPVRGEQHVVVSSAWGGGNSFNVLVNDYCQGQIVHCNTGWKSYVRLGLLNQDDIDAILDAIDCV